MRHPITAEQWSRYLSGEMEAGERVPMEAHLEACSACGALVGEMQEADRYLLELGRELRRSARLAPEAVDRARLLVFERIRETRGVPGATLQDSMRRMHDLLAPMCGPNTARLVMNKVAQRTAARTLDDITAERWPAFVADVVCVLKPLCGEPAARLVWESSRI